MKTDTTTQARSEDIAGKEASSIEIIGDVAGDTTTDVLVAIGDTVETAIELLGDNDYFEITLTEGQAISLDLLSLAIGPLIRIRDSQDNIVVSQSALGIGNLTLDFTADQGGTYYIDVSSVLGLGAYSLQIGPAGDTPETLIGTDEPETIHGYEGDDQIFGRGGSDMLYGDAGDDELYGELGWDTLYGGTGWDVLGGGNGNDRLFGGNGNDFLYGGKGDDVAFGGNQDDTIKGHGGADTLYGEAGEDLVLGGAGDDFIHGGAGSDELRGEEGNDQIYGGIGYDLLVGGVGDDALYGDNGNDQLYGQAGSDTLYGGNGNDLAVGGSGGDTLYGNDGDDILVGGDGPDVLYGGAGADRFVITDANPNNGTPFFADFQSGADVIILDEPAFLEISLLGGLLEAEFALGELAGDVDDRIIYDKATGNIFYDADGIGATEQVLIARVEAGTELTAADFEKADSNLLELVLSLGETPKMDMAPPTDMIIA